MTNAKYGDICDDCFGKDFCDMALFGGHNPPITTCLQFKKRKQTHGDRIRSWDDDQLAMWCFCLERADKQTSLLEWRDYLRKEIEVAKMEGEE